MFRVLFLPSQEAFETKIMVFVSSAQHLKIPSAVWLFCNTNLKRKNTEKTSQFWFLNTYIMNPKRIFLFNNKISFGGWWWPIKKQAHDLVKIWTRNKVTDAYVMKYNVKIITVSNSIKEPFYKVFSKGKNKVLRPMVLDE